MTINFGAALKSLRSRAGLSQEQLAHLLETDATNVSRMERNLQGPRFKMLLRMPEALQVTLTDLFLVAEQMGGDGSNLRDPHEAYAAACRDIHEEIDVLTDAQLEALRVVLAGFRSQRESP